MYVTVHFVTGVQNHKYSLFVTRFSARKLCDEARELCLCNFKRMFAFNPVLGSHREHA